VVDTHGPFAVAFGVVLTQLTTVLVTTVLLNEAQSMIKLRVPHNHVEVELLHLGLAYGSSSIWPVSSWSSHFGLFRLLLLRVTTETVVQIDMRLILHLTTPVFRKEMLQLLRELLQILIPKLRLGFITLLPCLLIQVILKQGHVGSRIRRSYHLV